jgi:hypothetical protein
MQRIQQQKERRERRKELMKSAKTGAAAKGDAWIRKTVIIDYVTAAQVIQRSKKETAMMMHRRRCHGAAARMPHWRVTCVWP